jgi:hypothetical protein
MSSGNCIRANLLGYSQKLIKLQVIVAETARYGCAARKVLLHKRPYHFAFKTVLMIDHVIRNPYRLGYAARVVHIVE